MGKFIGTWLILFGAVGFGWHLTQQERRHLELLKELKRVLICMCGDLEYARFPMQELLKNAEACVSEPLAVCLREMEQEMETQTRESVYEIWCQIWKKYAKELLLQEQELHIVQQAGQKLGSMEVQQQIELLRFAQKQLEEKIEGLQNREKETEKLYRSLSLLAGLFLVVFLL